MLKCITPRAQVSCTGRNEGGSGTVCVSAMRTANEVFKKAINISQKGRAGLGAAHLKVPSQHSPRGLSKVSRRRFLSSAARSPFHTLSAAVRPRVFYLLSASWCRLLLCANFHSYTNFIMLMCATCMAIFCHLPVCASMIKLFHGRRES